MSGARAKRRIRWRVATLAIPLAAASAGMGLSHTAAISRAAYDAVGIYPPDTTPSVVATDDSKPVELGTRFKVTTPGQVIGIRYYKSTSNTGTHVASLWTAGGRRLASQNFGSETASGWQSVMFSKPVSIDTGHRFVASYHTDTGHYSEHEWAYANGSIGNDTVRGLAGVYQYGSGGFPASTWHQSDYYVEPIFKPAATTTAPATASASPTDAATQTTVASASPTATSSPTTATASPTTATASPTTATASPTTATASPTTATSSPATSTTSSASSTWPNAQNTGATGTLTQISGRTITTDGTTLENVQVNGQLTIKANNVTLRNVHVKTDSSWGVLDYGTNLLVEDSTIEGVNGTTAGLVAWEGGWFVARRVNVFNSEDGVRLSSNSKLYDSYVHDLIGNDSTAHYDSVTADGYTGWEIVHNTILNPHSWTGCVWIGDPRYGPSEGLLKDNFIAGGGYSIYAGPGTGQGLRVVDNVFSTRYWNNGGYWGIAYKWDPTGNTWSGNVWGDGSKTGQAVTP